jgi:FG-GAP repeat
MVPSLLTRSSPWSRPPQTLASAEEGPRALLAEDLDGDSFPELAWTTDTAVVVLANAGRRIPTGSVYPGHLGR